MLQFLFLNAFLALITSLEMNVFSQTFGGDGGFPAAFWAMAAANGRGISQSGA
jgi:hypothetical protein